MWQGSADGGLEAWDGETLQVGWSCDFASFQTLHSVRVSALRSILDQQELPVAQDRRLVHALATEGGAVRHADVLEMCLDHGLRDAALAHMCVNEGVDQWHG